jgi:hypothetical protein
LTLQQIATNTEEAKSKSIFVAGWRPFVGWICGTALGYTFILQPFLVWLLTAFGIDTSMPKLEIDELMTLLFGMLGLGAMRSYDNKQKSTSTGGH